MLRRIVVVLVALVLVVLPVPAGAGDPAPVVLTGGTPVQDGIAWSQYAYPEGAGVAFLARDDTFPDALASSAAQGTMEGPLLFTPTGQLDPLVLAELQRLEVETVVILGGTAAVSEAVADELETEGFAVERIEGATRIATAVAVAQGFLADATTAILARAFGGAGDPTQAFADSLGAGPVAALNGWPVLLTDTAELSAETAAYLAGSAIERVIIAGGTAAVSQGVEDALAAMGLEVDRAAGASRFHTAFQLAQRNEAEVDPVAVHLTDGQVEDAWASGFAAASAAQLGPVILTNGDVLPDPSALFLSGFFLPLVCGPTVTEVACQHGELVNRPLEDAGTAILAGAEEVPGPGDEAGSGGATLVPLDDPASLCVIWFANDLEVSAAHIHAGAEGVAGDIVMPLNIEQADTSNVVWFTCAFDLPEDVVADIVANPGDYYANVHTADFPMGAVRGNFFVPTFNYGATADGAQEVPPNDSPAVGFFTVWGRDATTICVDEVIFDLDPPATAQHIHAGTEGVAGPVVVTLPDPGDDGIVTACVEGLDPATVAAIQAGPEGFYINIHNADFPDGAIRGQIEAPPEQPAAR